MQTITREHPGFEQLLNGVIDLMIERGLDISDVEVFKAYVTALIISDDEVRIKGVRDKIQDIFENLTPKGQNSG